MDAETLLPIFGVVMIIVGLGTIGYAGWCQLLVQRAQRWHRAEGTVLESAVERERSMSGHSTANTTFAARVAYQYVVNGRRYIAKTICLGAAFSTSMRSRADEQCERYPQGAAVEVWYDPANPHQACLERRAECVPFYLLIATAVLIVGLFLAL